MAWPVPVDEGHPGKLMQFKKSVETPASGYSCRRNLYCPMAERRSFEATSHLRQVGDRNYTGIRFGGSRSAVINPAVGVDDALVFVPAPLRGGEGVQRFPHAFGGGKLCIRPGLRSASRLGGQHRKQQQEQSRAQTPCALAWIEGLQLFLPVVLQPVIAWRMKPGLTLPVTL